MGHKMPHYANEWNVKSKGSPKNLKLILLKRNNETRNNEKFHNMEPTLKIRTSCRDSYSVVLVLTKLC